MATILWALLLSLSSGIVLVLNIESIVDLRLYYGHIVTSLRHIPNKRHPLLKKGWSMRTHRITKSTLCHPIWRCHKRWDWPRGHKRRKWTEQWYCLMNDVKVLVLESSDGVISGIAGLPL